ncbi:MAG: BamA/TamA family outer membrane protein [Xanthomonadales bacterium]|nr:BamA/TamA family outer membrane protein [Xanthomonadales bacterium]
MPNEIQFRGQFLGLLLGILACGGLQAAKLDRQKLEAEGTVIGEIRIYAGDVFDLEQPEENRFLYRLANRWHVETREGTIERLLLFKVGDPYTEQAVTESERLLRSRRAFFDARIRPVRMKRGKVIVEVRTRDIWSLRPALQFGRSGGRNRASVGFEELNFLGLGMQLSLGYSSDKDRDSRFAAFRAPQIGRARWELNVVAANNSDGHEYRLGLARPFFALDTRWSAGFDLLDDERREQRYRYGETIDRYLDDQRGFNIQAGWSPGLIGDLTQRFTFGAALEEHRFSAVAPIDGIGTTLLPEDRKLIYPWIGYELIQNRFVVEQNRDQMGRAEDILLGWHASARLGLAAGAFGADRRAWIYRGALSYGDRPNDTQSWLVSSEFSGRYENGGSAGTLSTIDARYDHRFNAFTTTHVRVRGDIGQNLDLDQPLALGGDNGLRGYPYRYANGERSALVTLEQRFYTDWYPFRLFRVGGAVFMDAGRVWGDTPEGPDNLGVLKDIGFGLRLANTRSGLGRVIHIDIAHPLDGGADISKLQFLISTEQSF